MSEAAGVPEKPPSVFEDLADVYVAPARMFRRRADAKFGVALLVLIVLSMGLFFTTRGVMQPIYEAEFTRGMAANPAAAGNPEALETARNLATTFAPILILVGIPIGILVAGIFIWIVGRSVGAKISYLQGATIATFAAFPRLIESIVSAVQAFMMDEAQLTSRFRLSLGLGRFLDPVKTGGALMAVLGRVDVFTLWASALVAIALVQMGRISTARAILGAAILWLLGSLPTLLGALRAG